MNSRGLKHTSILDRLNSIYSTKEWKKKNMEKGSYPVPICPLNYRIDHPLVWLCFQYWLSCMIKKLIGKWNWWHKNKTYLSFSLLKPSSVGGEEGTAVSLGNTLNEIQKGYECAFAFSRYEMNLKKPGFLEQARVT